MSFIHDASMSTSLNTAVTSGIIGDDAHTNNNIDNNAFNTDTSTSALNGDNDGDCDEVIELIRIKSPLNAKESKGNNKLFNTSNHDIVKGLSSSIIVQHHHHLKQQQQQNLNTNQHDLKDVSVVNKSNNNIDPKDDDDTNGNNNNNTHEQEQEQERELQLQRQQNLEKNEEDDDTSNTASIDVGLKKPEVKEDTVLLVIPHTDTTSINAQEESEAADAPFQEREETEEEGQEALWVDDDDRTNLIENGEDEDDEDGIPKPPALADMVTDANHSCSTMISKTGKDGMKRRSFFLSSSAKKWDLMTKKNKQQKQQRLRSTFSNYSSTTCSKNSIDSTLNSNNNPPKSLDADNENENSGIVCANVSVTSTTASTKAKKDKKKYTNNEPSHRIILLPPTCTSTNHNITINNTSSIESGSTIPIRKLQVAEEASASRNNIIRTTTNTNGQGCCTTSILDPIREEEKKTDDDVDEARAVAIPSVVESVDVAKYNNTSATIPTAMTTISKSTLTPFMIRKQQKPMSIDTTRASTRATTRTRKTRTEPTFHDEKNAGAEFHEHEYNNSCGLVVIGTVNGNQEPAAYATSNNDYNEDNDAIDKIMTTQITGNQTKQLKTKMAVATKSTAKKGIPTSFAVVTAANTTTSRYNNSSIMSAKSIEKFKRRSLFLALPPPPPPPPPSVPVSTIVATKNGVNQNSNTNRINNDEALAKLNTDSVDDDCDKAIIVPNEMVRIANEASKKAFTARRLLDQALCGDSGCSNAIVQHHATTAVNIGAVTGTSSTNNIALLSDRNSRALIAQAAFVHAQEAQQIVQRMLLPSLKQQQQPNASSTGRTTSTTTTTCKSNSNSNNVMDEQRWRDAFSRGLEAAFKAQRQRQNQYQPFLEEGRDHMDDPTGTSAFATRTRDEREATTIKEETVDEDLEDHGRRAQRYLEIVLDGVDDAIGTILARYNNENDNKTTNNQQKQIHGSCSNVNFVRNDNDDHNNNIDYNKSSSSPTSLDISSLGFDTTFDMMSSRNIRNDGKNLCNDWGVVDGARRGGVVHGDASARTPTGRTRTTTAAVMMNLPEKDGSLDILSMSSLNEILDGPIEDEDKNNYSCIDGYSPTNTSRLLSLDTATITDDHINQVDIEQHSIGLDGILINSKATVATPTGSSSTNRGTTEDNIHDHATAIYSKFKSENYNVHHATETEGDSYCSETIHSRGNKGNVSTSDEEDASRKKKKSTFLRGLLSKKVETKHVAKKDDFVIKKEEDTITRERLVSSSIVGAEVQSSEGEFTGDEYLVTTVENQVQQRLQKAMLENIGAATVRTEGQSINSVVSPDGIMFLDKEHAKREREYVEKKVLPYSDDASGSHHYYHPAANRLQQNQLTFIAAPTGIDPILLAQQSWDSLSGQDAIDQEARVLLMNHQQRSTSYNQNPCDPGSYSLVDDKTEVNNRTLNPVVTTANMTDPTSIKQAAGFLKVQTVQRPSEINYYEETCDKGMHMQSLKAQAKDGDKHQVDKNDESIEVIVPQKYAGSALSDPCSFCDSFWIASTSEQNHQPLEMSEAGTFSVSENTSEAEDEVNEINSIGPLSKFNGITSSDDKIEDSQDTALEKSPRKLSDSDNVDCSGFETSIIFKSSRLVQVETGMSAAVEDKKEEMLDLQSNKARKSLRELFLKATSVKTTGKNNSHLVSGVQIDARSTITPFGLALDNPSSSCKDIAIDVLESDSAKNQQQVATQARLNESVGSKVASEYTDPEMSHKHMIRPKDDTRMKALAKRGLLRGGAALFGGKNNSTNDESAVLASRSSATISNTSANALDKDEDIYAVNIQEVIVGPQTSSTGPKENSIDEVSNQDDDSYYQNSTAGSF